VDHEDQKVDVEEEKANGPEEDLELGNAHGYQEDTPVTFDALNSFVYNWVRKLSTTFSIPSLTAHTSATDKDGNLLHTLSSTFTDGYVPTNDQVDMIRISVTDFGPGISKENQKRLFHEIVQFDAAKLQQGKGSGIGLWGNFAFCFIFFYYFV
jgi:signal transduction histidine kinase